MNMKILIIKLGALGDVLRTTSILRALKQKYPQSQIYWITEKKAAKQLLNDNHLIDELIVYQDKYIENLKKINFDIIFNLDEDFKACSLSAALNKREVVGFILDINNRITRTESAREYYNMSALGKKPQNDILKKKNKKTYQQLIAEMMGISTENNEIIYHLNEKQKAFANDFRRHYLLKNDNLVIGLSTGTGDKWPSKVLPLEKAAELANKLYRELNAKLILFGGPNEVENSDKILSLTNVPIINSGCGTDISEMAAILSLCNIVITSDSLALHLSLALKRKVVAFFGPTSAAEIETYNLGSKVIPKDKCYCCYKPDCKALQSIKTVDILNEVKKLLNDRVSIILTSFKDPTLKNAIDSILKNDLEPNYELIIVSPDVEARELVDSYKNKNIKYFKDPGKGKSFALNLLFENLKSDILVFTDGDVMLDRNAIAELVKAFRDPIVGFACGRVVSANPKNEMNGYWSHLLADAGAHRIRKSLSDKEKFFEGTGYLMAMRNGLIKKIPLDVAEDSILPFYFYRKGYKIKYVENAKVYVKNPEDFKNWLKQRIRTAKAHETLTKHEPNFPRVKSFKNEVINGTFWALDYPKNVQEYYWTMKLFIARLYMWGNVLIETKILNKNYNDGWERINFKKDYEKLKAV